VTDTFDLTHADAPDSTVYDTSFGRMRSRPSTLADRQQWLYSQRRAWKRALEADQRVAHQREQYRALRSQGVAMRCRYRTTVHGSTWAVVRTAADFDAACETQALRALFDRDPQGYSYQCDKPRAGWEYVRAAHRVVALATDDAEAEAGMQCRAEYRAA